MSCYIKPAVRSSNASANVAAASKTGHFFACRWWIMNKVRLLGSHMGRFSGKDLVWWAKETAICFCKNVHMHALISSQQLERQNGQQWGVMLSPCLHTHGNTHMVTHTKRHTYTHTYILHMHQAWAERLSDHRMRSLWMLVASKWHAVGTVEHNHFLPHTHTNCFSALLALLYNWLPELCL